MIVPHPAAEHAERAIGLRKCAPPVDAVLFDLDGMLARTAPDVARALNRALSDVGFPPLSLEAAQTIIGTGARALIEQALALLGLPWDSSTRDALCARFEMYYQEVSGQSSELYPGIERGLHALRCMGVKMGVVTGKDHRFVEPLLHRFRLSQFFDIVVSGDTLPSREPDPASYLYACDALGVAPPHTLFVSDSNIDMQAAAAGLQTAWVSYGYNESRPANELRRSFHLADIAALRELIGGPRF